MGFAIKIYIPRFQTTFCPYDHDTMAVLLPFFITVPRYCQEYGSGVS